MINLTVADSQRLVVDIDVRQLGCALPTDDSAIIELLVDGAPAGQAEVTAPVHVRMPVNLEAGRRALTLRVPLDPDRERYFGDHRPTMVRVGGVRLEAGAEQVYRAE